jgi:hypothetical protein
VPLLEPCKHAPQRGMRAWRVRPCPGDGRTEEEQRQALEPPQTERQALERRRKEPHALLSALLSEKAALAAWRQVRWCARVYWSDVTLKRRRRSCVCAVNLHQEEDRDNGEDSEVPSGQGRGEGARRTGACCSGR